MLAKTRVAVFGTEPDVRAWFAQMGLEPMAAEDPQCRYVGFTTEVPPQDEWDLIVCADEMVPCSEEAGGYRK